MTDDHTATVQATAGNIPVLIFRSTSGRTQIARWADGTHSIHVLRGKDTLDADDISGLTQIFARVDVTEDDANETADTPKICDALCRDVEEDRDHLAAVVTVARTAAQRLLERERQHSGSGRDGHLDEDDLAPLLEALGIGHLVEPA